jgi:hypothetical protein
MSYMTYTDARAFEGMEIKTLERSHIKNPVLCPVCAGHGGWHLKLDAYGPGRHFNANCFQCNGWGYVAGDSDNATCIHTFVERTVGRCLHEHTCTKCGEKRIYDSSD